MSVTLPPILPPTLESRIAAKIATGRYASAVEVLEDAMTALDDRDAVERLRVALDEGDRGEGIPFTPALVARMKRDAARWAREGRAIDPDVRP